VRVKKKKSEKERETMRKRRGKKSRRTRRENGWIRVPYLSVCNCGCSAPMSQRTMP
jgi:hypothetical protein